MKQLQAADVMTRDVQTVRAHTTLEEIVDLLGTHHISGVPVVDAEGRLLGVVSEADLIDEHKRDARIPRTALFGLFPIPDKALLDAMNHGRMLQAQNLMSKHVATATEETTVHELADMMVKRKVNRIPILRDGRVVGIVTRGDLVRTLMAEWA